MTESDRLQRIQDLKSRLNAVKQQETPLFSPDPVILTPDLEDVAKGDSPGLTPRFNAI